MNDTSATAPKPLTLQESELQLNQHIYQLGRARYERMLAESREHAIADRCAELAKQTNELRDKALAELKATAEQSGLRAVPSPTDGPSGAPAPV